MCDLCTSDFVNRLSLASGRPSTKNYPQKGQIRVKLPIKKFLASILSLERVELDTSNLVFGMHDNYQPMHE